VADLTRSATASEKPERKKWARDISIQRAGGDGDVLYRRCIYKFLRTKGLFLALRRDEFADKKRNVAKLQTISP
jgi:hypothetical protein